MAKRRYMLLELDTLPKDKALLQAAINQRRYDAKQARRAIWLLIFAVLLLLVLYFVGASAVVYQWIAMCAGGVFVLSSLRLILRRRPKLQRVVPSVE